MSTDRSLILKKKKNKKKKKTIELLTLRDANKNIKIKIYQ